MVTRERYDGANLSVARVGVEEPEMSVSWALICGEISSIKLKTVLRDPPHQRQIALHRNPPGIQSIAISVRHIPTEYPDSRWKYKT